MGIASRPVLTAMGFLIRVQPYTFYFEYQQYSTVGPASAGLPAVPIRLIVIYMDTNNNAG